jgi:hypothetical protein
MIPMFKKILHKLDRHHYPFLDGFYYLLMVVLIAVLMILMNIFVD